MILFPKSASITAAFALICASPLTATVLDYPSLGTLSGMPKNDSLYALPVSQPQSDRSAPIAATRVGEASLAPAQDSRVAGYIRDAIKGAKFTDLSGDFLDTRYRSRPDSLVASVTPASLLIETNLPTAASAFSSTISGDDNISTPSTPSLDLAFALDSNRPQMNAVNYSVQITPVPEMATLFPLVGLLFAISSTHILRRRKMQRLSIDSVVS